MNEPSHTTAREEAALSIISGAMRINKGAAQDMTSVTYQVAWFKSDGLIKDRITVETLVDPSYVKMI